MRIIDLNKLCFLPGSLLPLKDGKYPYIQLLKQGLDNLGVVYPSSGGGGIESIVPGTNITVDDTDPLNPIVSASGGGGSFYVEVTKTALDALITAETLVPGTLYKITGVDPTLYDDGTTSGTTIFLKAVSTTQVSLSGSGLFYNPKYDQGIAGFGIWDSANSYSIGDKAIWGGITWENISGSVGSADDEFTLDASNWTRVAFSTTDYNITIDAIKYDYTNDFIFERADNAGNVVTSNFYDYGNWYDNYGLPSSPIAGLQWGNAIDYFGAAVGFSGNLSINSTIIAVNFKGNTFYNNYFSEGCVFKGNVVKNSIYNNIFNSSSFQNNILSGGSQIYNNAFSNYSSFNGNTITSNLLFAYNSFVNQSSFNNNTFGNGSFAYNNFNFANFTSLTTLTGKTINGINAYGASILADLSSATYIFATYPREVYARPDGTVRLKFINNSDVQVIVPVDN